jgi:hypothetical protein
MKHYLSLCAIFKNEASYLEEWLRFYDAVGVEHFYLYDNDSTDESVGVLSPWRAAGRVTGFRAPGRAAQVPAYRHCIKDFGHESVWIMFVDLDEFLFSPVQPDLRVFLQPYESEAAVVANWLMFGYNGHRRRPAGLTTLNFTRRGKIDLDILEPDMLKEPGLDPSNPANYHKMCHHIKSIVNTRDVQYSGRSPHDFRYGEGRTAVNANGRPVSGPFSDDLTAIQQLRINHYYSRSWEEFQLKLQRGHADALSFYDAKMMMKRNLLYDDVEDHDILPLARRVEADIREQKPPRALP